MTDNQELIDLIDRFYRGQLIPAEAAEVKKRIMTDPEFRNTAETHRKTIRAIKLVGNREAVKHTLSSVHLETPSRQEDFKAPSSSWKRLWPLAGIAASVAIISIMGTMLTMKSMEKEQTARYIEAVRKVEQRVEQIKESQNLIINNIAETKEKTRPQPGRYAGTGFLISSSGYLVTSHHVVKGADSVYIENQALGSMKATVVYSDASNDVSVLRIEDEQLKVNKLPYTIAGGEARLGEDVYTLGFPREDVVFGEGAISALTGYRQNPNSYQVSVPVNPGNSGGPLFNSKGDLVGIISGLQTETSGAAFAIKSSILLKVLEEMPFDSVHGPVVLPKTNSLKNLGKVDQVNKWKDNVFVVRVYNSK